MWRRCAISAAALLAVLCLAGNSIAQAAPAAPRNLRIAGQFIVSVPPGAVVTITAPTTNPTFTGSGSNVITTIAGTATAQAAITGCTWVNRATGAIGSATGTNSWSIASVPLIVGTNTIAVTCLTLLGGQGTAVLTVARPQPPAPTVIITTPTASPTYDAGTASTVMLAGTASTLDTITPPCTWTNSLGGSGSTTGTTSWSIASVALTVGSNVITVTCTDGLSQTGNDVITVTRSAASLTCAGTLNGTTFLWVSQSGAGSQNGTTTANARALSFFTNGANWGSGGTAIDPGDTVCLTGTITGNLAAGGSGSAGNVVTIDGTNATLSAGTGVNLTSVSFLTFTALTWVDGAIAPMFFSGATDITIQNCFTDQNFGFGFATNTHRFTLRNCYVRTTTATLLDQYDIFQSDGGLDYVFEGNYLELRINGACGACHDDIIQNYAGGGGTPSGWTIRNNRFRLTCTAPNDRSWMVLESNGGTTNIYGNQFEAENGCGIMGNGICCGFAAAGGQTNVYGNTFVSKNGAVNTFNWSGCGGGAALNIRNNVFYLNGNTEHTGGCTMNFSYNLWYLGGGVHSCGGTEICGSNPLFTDYANADYSLQAGSPARGAGFNFGSPYNTGHPAGTTWPTPTTITRTVPWDMGAYEQ